MAGLYFSEADDPLRALRWSLAELRRCLGDNASVDGDPVVLRLPENAAIDVNAVSQEWVGAVEVVGLGAELLDGLVVRGAPAFESWLLAERRRVAAVSGAILHEAALGLMARGALVRARGFAVRAAAMSPLDENHQALLIRPYRLMGDDVAAGRQYAAWTELLETELGVAPGVAIEAAMRERPRERAGVPTSATIEAALESGSATIAAGAIEPGVAALRSAVRLGTKRVIVIAPMVESRSLFDQFQTALGFGERARRAFDRSILDWVGIPVVEFDARFQAAHVDAVPTLVITDRGDRQTPYDDVVDFAESIDAPLVTTEGLGHRKILRDPDVVARVVEFVSGQEITVGQILDTSEGSSVA